MHYLLIGGWVPFPGTTCSTPDFGRGSRDPPIPIPGSDPTSWGQNTPTLLFGNGILSLSQYDNIVSIKRYCRGHSPLLHLSDYTAGGEI